MKFMNKPFTTLIIVSLGTLLFSISVRAGYLAFDHSGNLFASEVHYEKGHTVGAIFKFTPEGVKSTFASGLGDPVHQTFDEKGNLFVSDEDSNSIFKFTSDGVKSTFASGLNVPVDLAFDRSGNLFVTDFEAKDGGYSILKFTPDGKKSSFASGLSTLDYGVRHL